MMTKTILTSITAAALSMTSFAESIPALYITTDSDSTVICLKDISKIQYTDTTMIVLQTDGTEKTIAMDSVLSMCFCNTEDSGLVQAALTATEDGDDERTILFDLNGIIQGNTNKKGIHIIKSGKETKKVLK